MGRFSFLLATMKWLRKKKKVSSKAEDSERRTLATVKPYSKPTGFDNIPEDLLMKIFARLSAKYVTRLKCVSKLWYSLIASRYFTKLFLESPSSVKRQRLLVSLVDMAAPRHYKFLSSSSTHDDYSDTSVCVMDQVLNMPGLEGYFVNALWGLICVRLGRSLRIFNLTTRQRVILPVLRSKLLSEENIWNAFAHDPVQDEFKVLSTFWEVSEDEGRVVRSDHQVLVLGPGSSWRNTNGQIYPNRPYPQGCTMAINGVMYYGAWIAKNTSVVMSFDLASEDFSMIELPIEARIIWHASRANLMNYGDKVAVLEYSRLPSDATIDLWVLEDARKGKWSYKTLVLPLSQMNFVLGNELTLLGMGRRGFVWLTKKMLVPTVPRPYVIYDLEKNKIIRILEISPLPQLCLFGLNDGLQIVVWQDDIENIMYLET